MFSFMDSRQVEEMMLEVMTPDQGREESLDLVPEDPLSLRRSYLTRMQLRQGYAFPIEPEACRPSVEWACADADWRRTAEYLTLVDDLTQLERIPAEEGLSISRQIDAALGVLRDYDHDLSRSINNLVGCVFLAHVPGLHSVGSGRCLGAIAFSPRSSWTALDYASAILHEALHQALWLCQIVRRIYSKPIPRLADADSLVISPIRRVLRPYNLALHAACVLVEVVHLYRWAGQPLPPDEGSLELLAICIGELHEKRENLTGRGREILDQLEEFARP